MPSTRAESDALKRSFNLPPETAYIMIVCFKKPNEETLYYRTYSTTDNVLDISKFDKDVYDYIGYDPTSKTSVYNPDVGHYFHSFTTHIPYSNEQRSQGMLFVRSRSDSYNSGFPIVPRNERQFLIDEGANDSFIVECEHYLISVPDTV